MEDHMTSVREEVEKLTWVHTIDLGNGIITPGAWRPSPLILAAFSDIDFAGKKVLDIGCWDGLWAFEAEKRGASDVYATDCVTQRWGTTSTFELARKALRSKARYDSNISVFDIGKIGVHDFDVVIFCGIYYHLKDPLLAFSRLRQVMADGAIIVVEGDVIYDVADAYAKFFYRTIWHKDRSNWWVPTIPCLREWVECSYFEIVKEYPIRPPRSRSLLGNLLKAVNGNDEPEVNRYVITARAARRTDDKYSYLDPELGQFDRRA
jgi:tRNA (mo5U34)-methyltransferase